jgi:hypothetical protein
MANQLLTKSAQIRQRIERLEEELKKIKWDISFREIFKKSIVDLTKGILGSNFEKGVKYQRRIRNGWEKRMKRIRLLN